MCTICMKPKTKRTGTSVPNRFIDTYMLDADGSFIRVYLYLLRHYTGSNPDRRDAASLSVHVMADRLDCMETDIIRALKYWKRRNLLDFTLNDSNEISSILLEDLFDEEDESADESYDTFERRAESGERNRMTAESGECSRVTAESRERSRMTAESDVSLMTAKSAGSSDGSHSLRDMAKAYEPSDEAMERFSGDPAYSDIPNIVMNYLGGQVNAPHFRVLMLAYDLLHFQPELILFLFEYCADRKKTNPSYMQAVAIGWAENGIETEEEAKQHVREYDDLVIAVRKAFGLSGMLGSAAIEYIETWGKCWHMSVDLVEEACRRTSLQSANPKSFPYANKILKDWHDKGISDLASLKEQDQLFRDSKQNGPSAARPSGSRTTGSSNKFNDFSQRQYSEDEWQEIELAMRNRQ